MTLLAIALTPQVPLPSVKDVKVLESKVEYLLKTLSKFTMGQDNLEALLEQLKCAIKKARLVINNKKWKAYKNFLNFTKASSSPFMVYHYCMNKGHSSFKCMIKKRYGFPSGKYKWVPKGTEEVANKKGPNIIWVPKSTF